MSRTLTKKMAQVKAGGLFVGVDLGLDGNVAVILTERGQQVDQFSFRNDRAGYDYFWRRIQRAKGAEAGRSVLVGMEPTNYFWKLLAAEMEQKGQAYCLVNAYTVKKHREGDQLDRSKDDVRDAFTIADLVRTGKFTLTHLLHGDYAELRTYAKESERLLVQVVRQRNLVWGLVGQVFPELSQVFKSLEGYTVRAMLRQHSCAGEVRRLSEEEFLRAVRKDAHGHRLGVSSLRRAYRLAATSVGLGEGLEALQTSLRVHLELCETFEAQLELQRQRLLGKFRSMPEAASMLSIPGLGSLTPALILAELGDPHAYHSSAEWIKLAGTQPTADSSGRRSSSKTPMSHKGRSLLRKALFLSCLRLVRQNPTFAAWYAYYQTRSKDPLPKMQALGAVMNRLLKVLWALIRQHSCFQAQSA